MTLISKESKGSYNAVIANVNQKVDNVIEMIEKLVSSSENNSAELESKLSSLTHKASNLKTYVDGLLNINKQMDAHMPESCDYSWTYTETNYDCSESTDCGEGCDNDCGDCGEICNFCNDDCGEPSCDNDCGEPCSYDCGDCGDWDSCEESNS